MIPVREAGNDGLLEIAQDQFHGLAFRRAAGGKGISHFARLDAREHREALGVQLIIGQPIDNQVAHAAKFFWRHELFFGARFSLGKSGKPSSKPSLELFEHSGFLRR